MTESQSELEQINHKFFTISPQYKNANIANFVLLYYSKVKRPKKSTTLKGNPVYQPKTNFTFNNIIRYK